jgi:hypothetical protein
MTNREVLFFSAICAEVTNTTNEMRYSWQSGGWKKKFLNVGSIGDRLPLGWYNKD